MANDRSRSKSRGIFYEYTSTILYEFADLLKCMNYCYFDMTLLLWVLSDGAMV